MVKAYKVGGVLFKAWKQRNSGSPRCRAIQMFEKREQETREALLNRSTSKGLDFYGSAPI
jgi:hypothetical protein